MVDYIRAIKRPFADFKKLLIGILLNIPIPFVKIITNTMALGYAYKCCKTASESNYEMPEWKDYGKLWVNAFVAGIIGMIYLSPTIVMIFVLAKGLLIDYVMNETTMLINLISDPIGLIASYGTGILFVWAFSIMISYLTPIAMLNWIITEKFSSAFDFEDIFKKVFNRKYFVAWLIITLIGMTIGFFTLKFFPLIILQNPRAILMDYNLIKFVLFAVIISIIEFIQNIFTYTVFGNVLEELKKENKI